uniref:Vomeronasal type-1 receptor n=1 Tax=Plectus sambesii TaxID=2011161 RepID=A0A914VMP3_9BILA
MMPLRHSIIWSPEHVRFYIFAQWIIAFVVMIPGAFMELCDFTFNKVPDDGVAIVNGVNYTGLVSMPVFGTRNTSLSKKVGFFYQSSVAFAWAIGAILTLIVYLTLFGMLRVRRLQQKRRQSSRETVSATPVHEYRLLTYGVIMVLIQAAAATLEILMAVQGFNTWYRPQAIAVDIANYSHPYFLLILCTALRQRCFPCLFKPKSDMTIHPSAIRTNQRLQMKSDSIML